MDNFLGKSHKDKNHALWVSYDLKFTLVWEKNRPFQEMGSHL